MCSYTKNNFNLHFTIHRFSGQKYIPVENTFFSDKKKVSVEFTRYKSYPKINHL